MNKRSEAVKKTYAVTIEKKVHVRATVLVSVTARLERTRKGLIKNSAPDISEAFDAAFQPDGYADGEVITDIVPVEQSHTDVDLCPHCKNPINSIEVMDLGEVDD